MENPERERLLENIRKGVYQNIVIISGAGVSTASGIPDYRSSSGWFNIFPPETFTDRKCYEKMIPQRRAIFDEACPSQSHYLAVDLHKTEPLEEWFP